MGTAETSDRMVTPDERAMLLAFPFSPKPVMSVQACEPALFMASAARLVRVAICSAAARTAASGAWRNLPAVVMFMACPISSLRSRSEMSAPLKCTVCCSLLC